jgi:hypothetical protein
MRFKACKKECKFNQERRKHFRWKHLDNRLRVAQEQEDKKAFNKISAINQWEQLHTFWCKLNYVIGKKRMRSATSVQVEGQNGAIMEHTTQDTVEQIIFSEIHEKRFTLAGEAPICNGELFRDFGYTASTPASKTVLDGTYAADG